MSELKLQPKAVFDCFAEINKIPRPSHKEQKMGAFLIDFGKKHGLETLQDSTGNVLIRKPATKGMENLKTTVLQSHMDMVCEKEAGLNFDFEKDAIQTYIDGDWLKAKGTTLGADDGIGVAMQMAILADNTIQHGPLECLFTVCEEEGLNGAMGLEAGFMKADYLINLDSEDEGLIFVSCAGGANTKATFNVDLEDTPANQFFFKIQISGLTGGHSGDDIEKKRANANKLLARLLEAFKKYDIRIADIQSGGLHNAIPRDGYAVACVPTQFKENLRVDFNVMTAEFEEEFSATEQNMRFKLESTQPTAKVIDKTSGNNLITALVSVPNGVLAMDQNIPDFVETSSNLASIHLNKDKVNIVTSQRSNIMSARKNASAMVRGVFSLAGADAETGEGYPGWKLDPNSPLLSITVEAYKRLFAKDPEIRAIHAGLECGLFSLKYPHVDMVSFGPTLRGVHSPEERLLIPTVQKVWEHLLETLKNIPAK
ncbi:MAG: aminoacyl-histidine dipeptidase [Bacteroidaceae bacterium]|nr:aminoacyl-histidine dipeptidase [Prevotellaceae bacterium]MDY2849678.1 aminoacyl-histidine dipeptidase [Bacteroidaceae bacterium]